MSTEVEGAGHLRKGPPLPWRQRTADRDVLPSNPAKVSLGNIQKALGAITETFSAQENR